MSDHDKDKKFKGATSGWYVLLMAWVIFAVAYFVVAKTMVTAPTDVTNAQMLSYGSKFGPFAGLALGLLAYLATGLVYLIVRFFTGQRRLVALAVSALGYGGWLAFGYDLVYVEPRFAQVAIAIIAYMGKPMLYASALVVGLCAIAAVGCVVRLILKNRRA